MMEVILLNADRNLSLDSLMFRQLMNSNKYLKALIILSIKSSLKYK